MECGRISCARQAGASIETSPIISALSGMVLIMVSRGQQFQPKLASGGADEHSPRGQVATSPVIIPTHSDPVLWDNRPPTIDDENGLRSEWIFAGCDSGVAF